MTFEKALEFLKSGGCIGRSGWNGKGMWLMLVKDWHVGSGVVPELAGTPLLPFIGMKTADDKFVPWLASQTDILADDWEII